MFWQFLWQFLHLIVVKKKIKKKTNISKAASPLIFLILEVYRSESQIL